MKKTRRCDTNRIFFWMRANRGSKFLHSPESASAESFWTWEEECLLYILNSNLVSAGDCGGECVVGGLPADS